MKFVKKFNEAKVETLTISDIRSIKHNLGRNFLQNYGWTQDQMFKIDYRYPFIEKENMSVHTLLTRDSRREAWYDIGCVVIIDDEVKFLVSIYEIHGCQFIERRNLLAVYGHEDVILLWLDDGEFNGISMS